MTQDEALRLALEALKSNRRTHYYCEDTWYSCPKHEDGCANDSEGDECNCGADKANAEIDQAITAVEAALETKDKPVGAVARTPSKTHFYYGTQYLGQKTDTKMVMLFKDLPLGTPVYTTPPQPVIDESAAKRIATALGWEPKREWVGLTEQEQGGIMEDLNAHGARLYEFAAAIEAKLKEKNG